MKKTKTQKLTLETFKISKLTNLNAITGGNSEDDGDGDMTLTLSSRKCKKDDPIEN